VIRNFPALPYSIEARSRASTATSQSMPLRQVFAAAVVAGSLAACVAARPAAPRAPAPATVPTAASTGDLPAALDAAIASGRWRGLRIEAECPGEDGPRAVVLFGSGTGIWNGAAQFALPSAEIVGILRAFREALAATPPAATSTSGRPAVLIVCRARLELDGHAAQLVQTNKEGRRRELWDLAERIFAVTSGPGGHGERAATLADGLRRVASGELRPEVLRVVAQWRQDPAGEGPGWFLELDGGAATSRAILLEGYGEPRRLDLDAAAVRDLARRAVEAGFPDLPLHVDAPAYLDLTIAVLAHTRTLQARRFAGADPARAAAAERLAPLVAALADLHRSIQATTP